MSGRANRKEGSGRSRLLRLPAPLRHRRHRGPGRISGTHRGFSDPLPRFQMLVNLPGSIFTRPLPPAPGPLRLHSGSLCPSAEGAPASPVQPAPIRGALSAGDWARCPPPAPQALSIPPPTPSTVYLLPGRLPSLSPPSTRPPPSAAVFPPQSECFSTGSDGSERPSVARGLPLVPRLHF